MNRLKAAVLAAGLIAPGVALSAAPAPDLSYRYLQGGIAYYPGFGDQDFVGADLRGVIAITPEIFLFGAFKYLTDDVDLKAGHVGGGYRLALGPETDVYGGLSAEYQRVEANVVDPDSLITERKRSTDDTSLGVRAGVRHLLVPQIEVGGEIRYVTGDLDYFGLAANIQYFINPRIGLIGEIDVYDDEMGVIGGARVNF